MTGGCVLRYGDRYNTKEDKGLNDEEEEEDGDDDDDFCEVSIISSAQSKG